MPSTSVLRHRTDHRSRVGLDPWAHTTVPSASASIPVAMPVGGVLDLAGVVVESTEAGLPVRVVVVRPMVNPKRCPVTDRQRDRPLHRTVRDRERGIHPSPRRSHLPWTSGMNQIRPALVHQKAGRQAPRTVQATPLPPPHADRGHRRPLRRRQRQPRAPEDCQTY